MTEVEKLRALLAEARKSVARMNDDALLDSIDAALAEPVVETLTIDQHKEVTQKRVDHTIHYRNLAIVLGAKPNQMLTDYDKELCEKGIDPDDNSGGYHWSVRDSLDEAEDLWEKNERLERERDETQAEVERLQDERARIEKAHIVALTLNRTEAYQRGAEAMREAAALCVEIRKRYWIETSAAEGGLPLVDYRAEEASFAALDIRDLPLPEDK
jgi:hypothetical protein